MKKIISGYVSDEDSNCMFLVRNKHTGKAEIYVGAITKVYVDSEEISSTLDLFTEAKRINLNQGK